MNADILLRYFDRISEAPDAIPRLRRFILDLAVRGKLVEQDSQDEPASKLLKRIQAEKARRIKAGELRSPRSLDWADEIEELFSLPKLWTWIRLADIGAIIGGGTPPSGDYDNFTNGGAGVAWLTPADLGKHDGLYVSHGARDLTEKGLQSSSATLMPKDTVLFTSRAPIGYTAIAANEITTNQGFKSVVPYIVECSRYIAAYLQAFGPWIDSKASGTTFREVSGKIVSGFPFPLPPLAEQQRIVAKVDELMALCDQLEAARNEREARRQRLTAASLQRLNQPADAAALRADARFHLDNLPRLTTRQEQIKQLRQTILNLAVRGCLVAQDPKDEPASELLKRISVERAGLVREGRIRKEKVFSLVSDENVPFEVPKLWAWAKVGVAALFTEYGTSQQSHHSDLGVPVLKMGDIQGGKLLLGGQKKVSASIDDLPTLYLENSDLLYNRTNSAELVGKTGIYIGNDNEYTFASYLIRIRCSKKSTSPAYFNMAMNAPCFRETQIIPHLKQQCGQANVNGTILKNMLVPLPPLAEQHRIVARVDELMALCDQLETQLITTATDSRRLLEAVLRDAIRPQAQA